MYIFDFDGTLMDTSAVILSTIKATVKELGLPERSDAQCRTIIGIRTDEAGHHLFPDAGIDDAEFARVFRANYARIRSNAHERAFPGVIDTLCELHHRGKRMAIASSRREDSLHEYLGGLGIEGWFEMIVGAGSVSKGKPDPEPVLHILHRTGADARTTLVVGDADVDIIMGNRAGCMTCAVTYGNGSEEALRQAHPTFITGNFAELLNIDPEL